MAENLGGCEMSDQKELEIVQPKELQIQSETGLLLKLAVDKDLDVEKFKALIDLQNQQEERHCKRDFATHFSEMQKEFTPIKRSKKGDKGNYSPVDELQKKYSDIISSHGFSYTWNEELLTDKSLKTTMTISGYGHEVSNSKVLPEYIPDKGSSSGKAIMNPLQAEGTRSTYNQRYTFKAGFGITETDEDTDGGLTFNDGVQYAEQANNINNCNTVDELKKVWTETWTKLGTDSIGKQILTTVYNDKKKVVLRGTV